MSGKPSTGPKPQAPMKIKGFKLTVTPVPKVDVTQEASLTVLPSNVATTPEDQSQAPKYTGVPSRKGMFGAQPASVTTTTSVVAPGKKQAKPNITRRLMDNEETVTEVEEVPVPAPTPAPAPPVVATKAELPAIAKEFLGKAIKAPKKSYAEYAIKKRFTDDIADTLIDLGEQLDALQLGGLDFDEGVGFTPQAELVDGKTKFLFDDNQRFEETPKVNEAKLTALDDLFKSLRLRMNYILGEGSLAKGSTSPVAKDYQMLLKLISYAPKYKKDKPKLQEKERILAIKDLITDEMADTLLQLEETFAGMEAMGIDLQSMKVTPPSAPGLPFVYTFEDDNTFLIVDDTEESRKKADERLSDLDELFPGGTRIRLNSITGLGPYDEEGTPLQSDLQFLQDLFGFASEMKQRVQKIQEKAQADIQAEEAKRVKTLEGTEYEALAKPIEQEITKSPYEVTTDSAYKPGTYKDKYGKDATIEQQKGFIPATRRAFGYFIYDKYRRYMLKALEKLDPNACLKLGDSSTASQIYEYQKFVRDYISFMTPYRGVLVYHGLGSGKTCTAIAASEALLSSGGKRRIIVMTPFSLRKNFIQQITFCGFRHYRLYNYWTPHEYRATDGKNALWLFATSVMKIPESYMTPRKGKPLRIWIPDLNRTEENYSKLTGQEQAEIRNQIYETLVYDPYKGKNGLIWFLNYNGITASKLRDLACKVPSDAFDNAVIVIDEIHNLVRLMQGTIDPYLKKMYLGQIESEAKGDKKYLDVERMTTDKWRPKYCGKTMNYKRGYLFYRLLVEAKNTKIVGLSGTPLINFPEELGILANILHGYNYVFSAGMPKVSEPNGNKRIVDSLKVMAEGDDPNNFCEDLDFYEVTIDDKRAVIDFTFTFLPEGYRKIQGQLGVERIPFTETLRTTEEKLTTVRGCIDKVLKSLNPNYSFTREFKQTTEPLLPVMGEPSIPENAKLDDSFKGRFVDPTDGVSIMNEQVLMKRLSGLISYYKGSRKDLMPEITEDEIVRVPMSLEQQKKYIAIRLQEIKIEQQKEAKKGLTDVRGGRSDDAELKKLSSSQNYRMASRQACNFVFPDGFTRPRPLNAKQAKDADEFGGNVEELMGEEQVNEQSALVGTQEEEEEASIQDRKDAEEARQDDEMISRQLEEEEIAMKKQQMTAQGKPPGEIEQAIKEIRDRYEQERLGGLLLAQPEDETPTAEMTAEMQRCMANILPNETYQMAINRAKECLLKYGLPKLALVDSQDSLRPSPLGRWSPKFKAILENINSIQGSSLVYSQFLGMEGIGIFTIAMQANQYTPIKIVSREGQFVFDERTEASIRKGPNSPDNKRFILFTGGEEEEIRKINIDIFNAKFTELPPKIKQVLEESGFTSEIGNKRGELCRVFCITAAGAEGLSLKNVRSVHIMEPYWNDVRMAQVKGRAVRICSHQELPLKERNVRIFTYITVFDKIAQDAKGDPREGEKMKWAIPQEIWNRDALPKSVAQSYGLDVSAEKGEYAMTSDERLYFISEKKKKLVENLIVVMKTAASDCLLNYKENMDGTYICRLLGNEGDFLYHPNLQKDIETNKNDDIGDIFTVPEAQLAEVKAAQAKLRFEEEEEEKKEEEAVTTTTTLEPKVQPVAPRLKYPVKLKRDGKDVVFVASAVPDNEGKVDKFFLYEKDDTAFATPVGESQAEFKANRWIPKAGTVKLSKK